MAVMAQLPRAPAVSVPLDSSYAEKYHDLMFRFQGTFMELRKQSSLENAQPNVMVKVFNDALAKCRAEQCQPNMTLDLAERTCEVLNLLPSITYAATTKAYFTELSRYIQQRDQKLSNFKDLFYSKSDKLRQVAEEDEDLMEDSPMSMGALFLAESRREVSVPDGYRQLFLQYGTDRLPLDRPSAYVPWSWHLPVCVGDERHGDGSLVDVEAKAEYTKSWEWPPNVVTLEDLEAADCPASMHIAAGGMGIPMLKAVHDGLAAYLVGRGPQRGQIWVVDSRFVPCVVAPFQGKYAKIFASTKQFDFLDGCPDPVGILDFYTAMLDAL